ncbi:MAG TPA: ribonuclease III [Arachnia sp.]|nr:ribonuclease III [Arachnia sp.]HMT87094.1 ribonuclease III [Arachnia sp.]
MSNTLPQLLDELGVEVDAQLFELALTHRSYAFENGGIPSNERLEFLGDAVLQIVVTEHLYRSFPELAEGQLAKLRASVVNTQALAGVARRLQIGPLIKLGRGERLTGGADKASILADTTEAIIGAVHLAGGAPWSHRFVHVLFDPLMAAAEARADYLDHKTALQEACSQRGWEPPRYVVEGAGPDHMRTFTADVIVDGRPLGHGVASSKKHAEQLAARAAFRELGNA